LVAHSIWLHLAKLKASGVALGSTAAARFVKISATNPQWCLAADESDEFSHWMSSTGDPDYEDRREIEYAPRKRKDLVQWLTKVAPVRRPFYEDTWREVCRSRFFHSLSALCELAQNDVWPVGRWRETLQVWAEDGMVSRSWRYAAPLVQTMPNAILQEIVHGVSGWMEVASKSINVHESILLKLCCRVLKLPLDSDTGMKRNGVPIDQPVMEAINHPVGHVTSSLINLWFRQNPNDNDLLPAELKPIFTSLCDPKIERFRHGRVLMGSRLIAFFRVDRAWTEQHLLTLFSWRDPVEAKAAWQGFLWSPRLYQPLLIAYKSHFLDSAIHYTDLGEHSKQFATLLTYAALGPTEGFTVAEFRSAFGHFPQEGLEASAQALFQALEGAAEQREDYWKNRVRPFWQQIWPKSRELASQRIAESLARLVIAARGEFMSALAEVQDWLQPIEYPRHAIRLLNESGLCSKYPTGALRLLNALIADQGSPPEQLGKCLDDIVQVEPRLAQDIRHIRLTEYFRIRRV
jgi:hypothetical protein